MKKVIVSVLVVGGILMGIGCVQNPITPAGAKVCQSDNDCNAPYETCWFETINSVPVCMHFSKPAYQYQ